MSPTPAWVVGWRNLRPRDANCTEMCSQSRCQPPPRGGGWVAKSPTNDCPLHVNMQSKSMSPTRDEGGWLAKSPPNQCQLQRACPRAQKWALGPILLSQPLLNPLLNRVFGKSFQFQNYQSNLSQRMLPPGMHLDMPYGRLQK